MHAPPNVFLIPFIFALCTLLFFAPAHNADAEEPAQTQVLRLAMSGAFQPFSTTDAEGRLVGFDADIAREIGKRLNCKTVLVQTDWAGIQAGLQSGKYELICGSMAITPPRLEAMRFSLPYYVSGAQVFVQKGRTSLEGATIGVGEDSTYARYIKSHPEQFEDAKVVTYGSEAEIVAAMNADKIDAFVSDRIVGGFYAKKGGKGNIVPLGDLLYKEACGISATKASNELIRKVNDTLFAMIQDGTYGRIYRKWVGSDPDLETLLTAWGDYAENMPIEGTVSEQAESDRPTFASSVWSMIPSLVDGAILTLKLSIITGIAALVFGAIIGVGTGTRNTVLRGISNGYIWIVRGTPLLVQLFMSYFVLATVINRFAGSLMGTDTIEVVGAFGAALIALIVNTTAYNAETIRGGINAVLRGQWDAAASLGMSRFQIMSRVILPQAFRNALPSLGNNLVVLIKDTSLVGAITLIELTYTARNVVFQTGQAFLPFLLSAVFYLCIISLVTIGVRLSENYLKRSRRKVGSTI